MTESILKSTNPPTNDFGAPLAGHGRTQGHARRAVRWLPFLASLMLAACATLPSGAPEEQVRQRANERWQAMVAGNFASAYTYNTPGFKAVVTPDAYKGRFSNAAWWGAEVVDVTCPEAVKCIAKVRISLKHMLERKYGKLSTYYDETWLLEEGQWWLFQVI